MLQFKKTLLGGIAPVLLSIALASPVIASDAHHAHGKDHNFGHFTKDNLFLLQKITANGFLWAHRLHQKI